MAQPSKVSYELVAATADKMLSQNEIPSARKVREILGTGSMNTIIVFFHKWQDKQARQSQSVDDLLSPSIADAISDSIASKVLDATAAITLKLVNLQEELAQLLIESSRKESDLEIQAIEYAVLLEQNAALTGRIHQLEVESTRITTELITERHTAETGRIELAKSLLRLEAVPRIEAEGDFIRLELLQTRTQAAELHEIAAVATARLEAEINQRKNDETRLVDAMRQRDEADKRSLASAEALANERSIVQSFQLRNEASLREVSAANDSAELARAESKKACEEAAELRGYLASSKTVAK